MNPYGAFFLYLLAVLGTIGAVLALNALLGPRVQPSAVKLEPFECGVPPIQPRNVRRLSIRYYPIAIFFLLFDLEAVLLFIWAAATPERDLATLTLVSFLAFFTLLAAAFAYIWRDGGLEW